MTYKDPFTWARAGYVIDKILIGPKPLALLVHITLTPKDGNLSENKLPIWIPESGLYTTLN
jgi:hypothetical protein